MQERIILTRGAIERPEVELASRETGAVAEFWGVVREREGERDLEGLWYEAYEPMALRLLSRMFAELAQKHACQSVTFVHRLGWVPVGEGSLWVRVQSSHRREAFAFLSEAIDRLKMDIPIWKKA